ncbi:MAG TPA: hypothetical protein VGF59_17920 [Bryobacteraceae bacterium]
MDAIAGMIPSNQSELDPALHAIQSMVNVNRNGEWRIALFQNTPAAFHGRPKLKDEMTEELRRAQVCYPLTDGRPSHD